MSGDYYDKFRDIARDADEKRRGLEATGITLKYLIGDRQVMVDDMPLEALVATELELDNPGRIAANHEVRRLLKIGAQSVASAAESQRHREASAESMLPRQDEPAISQKQIH